MTHRIHLFFRPLLAAALLLGGMLPGAAQRTFSVNISDDGEAVLTAFLAENPDGRAMLAFPGGGYSSTGIGNNALWAPLCDSLGISLFILKYRMPKGDPSVTLGDAEASMRLIREHAAEWGVDPAKIGVMGTSAGGHLASMLATCGPQELRPAFQVLFYPVITFGEGCHAGSRDNFLGAGSSDPELLKRYSAENHVTAQTPPALIFANTDDRTVPPEYNAVAYYVAMKRCGASAALYIYPEGGHGWNFATALRYHDQVVDELTAWLQALSL